jgi:flagellin
MLQRIRELAVQSSNASNSSSDRKALQTEVSQLTSELNRVASTTQFNGQNLLDGTMGTANFQVGANANQLISMTGANFTTSTYGNNTEVKDGLATAATGAVGGGDLVINGSSGSATVTLAADISAKNAVQKINDVTGSTGVTATAQTNTLLKADTSGGNPVSYTFAVVSDNDPTKSPVNVSFQVGTSGTADDYAAAVSAFNAQTAKTGVTASYDATAGGLKLTNANGNDIKLTNNSTDATASATLDSYKTDGTVSGTSTTIGQGADGVAKGTITLDSSQSFSTSDASGWGMTGSSDLKSVANIDVSTFDGAQQAIKIADAALAKVDDQRSQLGALQSRFDSTISNLQSTNQNLSASKSRIVDTDFASETANMTRGQILQQAGTSMLAQANSLPNGVLSLLRG